MFEEDSIYHVYNRANGNENLFREERNYSFFLDKYIKHISPVVTTYAYCLMPNHFHLMIRTKKENEVASFSESILDKYGCFGNYVSKQFSNLFSSYSQSYNKVYSRRGSLFQPNMKYKKVEGDNYFTQLILYIHRNPIKHGFVKHVYDWPHSSIHQFRMAPDQKNLKVLESAPGTVINWFGGIERLLKSHQEFRKVTNGFN